MNISRRRIQKIIENSFLTVPAYYVLEGWYEMRYLPYRHIKFLPEDQ